MYCGKCGNEIPNGALFCPKCGEKKLEAIGCYSDEFQRKCLENREGKNNKGRYLIASTIIIATATGVALLIITLGTLNIQSRTEQSKDISSQLNQDKTSAVYEGSGGLYTESGDTETETEAFGRVDVENISEIDDQILTEFKPNMEALVAELDYPIVQIDDMLINLDATCSVGELFAMMDKSVLKDGLWLRKGNGEALKRDAVLLRADAMAGWTLMYNDELVAEVFGSTASGKDYYSVNEIYVWMINAPIRRKYNNQSHYDSFATQYPSVEHVVFWKTYSCNESKSIDVLYSEMGTHGIEPKLDYNGGTLSCGEATFMRVGESSYALMSVLGLNRDSAVNRGIIK